MRINVLRDIYFRLPPVVIRLTCDCAVNVGKSLLDYMVEADSVNSFKSRLDKYWANQEFVFNLNSELIGTGGLPVCM